MTKTLPILNSHRYWIKRAEALLDVPVRTLALDWSLERALKPKLRLLRREGVVSRAPFVCFSSNLPCMSLEYGLERYELALRDHSFSLVKVEVPAGEFRFSTLHYFWATPRSEYRKLSRALRRFARGSARCSSPVMSTSDRSRLWNNTVGFLTGSDSLFRKYHLPKKRGVLLLGTPGNGKTMACRWLQAQCARSGLAWRSVSAEEYRQATSADDRSELFHLDEPGIVLFDDLDFALRDRVRFGATPDHTTFLSELDGISPKSGIVFLFTSNMLHSDLDPAFRRPGRIDLILQFSLPTAELREELIATRWHDDIRHAINIPEAVRRTDGFSFAELEELRKLVVLNFLDTGCWDFETAWSAFRLGRGEAVAARRIGFHDDANSASLQTIENHYELSATS